MHGGAEPLQLAFVVHVGDVDLPFVQGETGNALLMIGSLRLLAGVQSGLDPGDDGAGLVADGVNRQPVGLKPDRNRLADFSMISSRLRWHESVGTACKPRVKASC